MGVPKPVAGLICLTVLALVLAPASTARPRRVTWRPPPVDAAFDYQIGAAYPPPAGTKVVSRDWHDARPAAGLYSICYVNAFQTQSDRGAAGRPDATSAWPRGLVLTALGDDPGWPGEFLVDLSRAAKRRHAAAWVAPMLRTCARKGYAAVELDNLDSWQRFDGTRRAGRVPFGKADALAYAALLTRQAHALGLAAAQKNAADLSRREARRVAGFDFAIAEECAAYRECGRFRHLYGDHVIDIEYRRRDYHRACRSIGPHVSVVLRDREVSAPGAPGYVDRRC